VTLRLLIPACLLLTACSHQAPLPVLGQVPDFTLTAQTGQPFQGSTLLGHVWIADFIYTNCPGPCPLMTQRLKRVQQATGSSIRLVSFTVDPARDTPAALTAYARRFGAKADRWTFLTGDPKTLNMLDRDAFKLGALDPSFDHSTRFVLVDARNRIRGYYGMGLENMVERISKDAQDLEKEKT
jgi:protein SCO1/2